MTEKMPIKEAKKKFIKRSFYCSLIAVLIFWFMKMFGIDIFELDLDNKFFNDLDLFFKNHLWIKEIYSTLTLNIQLYLMTCIVNRKSGKEVLLFILKILPFTIIYKVIITYFIGYLGNYSLIFDILYLVIMTSMLHIKKMPRAIFVVLFLLGYQIISSLTRSLKIKSHQYGFVATQILSIDVYLLLNLHKEVSKMGDGTWLLFGFTAWIYRVAGFIVGIFTGHPIKKSREWYEKGKAKEDARKAKKQTK